MKSEDLQRKIDDVKSRMAPLQRELSDLERQQREACSREYIAMQKIKRSDVERSDGDGKPWFGHVSEFAKWMNAHGCEKPWCEWNGRIYEADEVRRGVFKDTPAEYDHLTPNV